MTPTDEAAPSGQASTRSGTPPGSKRALLIGAVVAGLVVVVIVALLGLRHFKGSSSSGGRETIGTVVSLDGSSLSLSLASSKGSAKVVTTGSTTFTSASAGVVSDLRVGDNVQVQGATSGTTIDAGRVTDDGALAVAAAGPTGRGVTATISAVDGTTATVKAADGKTYTVTTTSATKVTLIKPSSLSALAVGDTVRVVGKAAGDGAITASSVRKRPPAEN